ncbi:MAG TPA: SLATT domain-containing protein [Candidatus Acidoferrum sp.]|nr:SLATT domain-containing protein [Candidatus Acidoferrum sp.]
MPTLREVLDDWYERVCVTQRAHYLSADHFKRKSYWLGVPVIGLTTVVGTSVFATIQKQPVLWQQVTAGLASVAAAILASLQTFLGYAERAEKHRVAGAKYGALGRELEVLRASDRAENDEILRELRKRLDALALESPNNPIWIYHRAGAALPVRSSGRESSGS